MSFFTFVFAVVCTVLGFVYLMAKLRLDRNQGLYQEDEAAQTQELHRNLARMEQRIETLETLLLERETAQQRSETTRRD